LIVGRVEVQRGESVAHIASVGDDRRSAEGGRFRGVENIREIIGGADAGRRAQRRETLGSRLSPHRIGGL
jgi:hypothetical protein